MNIKVERELYTFNWCSTSFYKVNTSAKNSKGCKRIYNKYAWVITHHIVWRTLGLVSCIGPLLSFNWFFVMPMYLNYNFWFNKNTSVTVAIFFLSNSLIIFHTLLLCNLQYRCPQKKYRQKSPCSILWTLEALCYN